MPQRILVAVAWPYANGSLHLGHLAGCYLPADIFARYHRLRGNQVLMLSGSDQHGTPITIRAEQEGLSPQEVVDKYHTEFKRSWERMGISFDLFTQTSTDNHREVVQDIFLTLYNKGYIYTDTMLLPYCPNCSRFLPDRYVHGTCPNCGNTNARGDQCDSCGKTLNPEDLSGPQCSICNTVPQFKDSEHFFLRLTAFQHQLLEWVQLQSHWRPNVLNFTRSYLEEGLKDRAISRDISWGVPLPLDGYDSKRIYVWFEAVIGYLSASKEWAQQHDQPDKWEEFWKDPDAKAYYFIGKDNIPFHTIIWPAIIMGYGGLNLPYNVPANEFLSLENRQFSTSRNWAVWLPDYLERYDPDPLRYYLSINMPESGDSDFSWTEFVRRNNDELVATYGNLVHRVLTFTYRNFEGKVPQPVPERLDESDKDVLSQCRGPHLEEVGGHIDRCNFRLATSSVMALAQLCNRYIDSKAPWKTVKDDRDRTANTMWVCLNVLSCLKTITYPFIPFSAQKLHNLLGFSGKVEDAGWRFQEFAVGQPLSPPEHLFTKLDDKTVEEESLHLEARTI